MKLFLLSLTLCQLILFSIVEAADDPFPGAVDIDSSVALIESLFNEGRYKAVDELFEKAYSFDPYNPAIHFYRGRALTRLGRYDEAEAVLKWVNENSDYPGVLMALGELFMRRERWQSAIGYYTELLDRHKDSPFPAAVFVNLGMAWWRSGNTPKALGYLYQARQMLPDDKNLKAFIAKLEREETVESSYASDETQYFSLSFEDSADQREVKDRMLRLLEDCLSEVARDLWYPEGEKIQVVLYPGTGRAVRALGAPDWVRAAYDGKLRIPANSVEIDSAEFAGILRHELTHLVLHSRFGENIPGWINEGMAVNNEGRDRGGMRLEIVRALKGPGALLDFRFLSRPTFVDIQDVGKVSLAYAQSYYAVRFMKDRWYDNAPVDVLEELAKGASLDKALFEILAVGIDEFNAEFAKYCRERFHVR